MLEVKNVEVYDLEQSVISCRNSMRIELPEYTVDEFTDSLVRACKLAPLGNGHNNFLSGIRVSFDLIYPNYISPELQRYHFFDIVCSSSKMHKIMYMDFDKCCNKYVNKQTKNNMKSLILKYNESPCYENFMKVISNCPQGIELFMRCSTNYLQLRTIYSQRKNHKLKEDWSAFCKFIEELPYANELILS
jgi:hypothetical protein